MKNLARGSVFLASLLALIVSLFYFEQQVGAVTTSFSADLSNSQINSFEKEKHQEQNKQDKKSVTNSTVAEQNENNQTNLNEENTANSATKGNARGFSATTYCLRGRTANGASTRRGIVAADPRVLPLGTRIYLNAGGYSGNYVVADTGGAVKGRKLDIWVPNCAEAMRFGRRNVSVSVLGKG